MRKKIHPVAAGYRTLTPRITVKDARKAIEFYVEALGVVVLEKPRVMPDGRVGHAVLKIGDSKLMLTEEFPESGSAAPRGELASASLYVYTPEVDKVFDDAVSRGAKVVSAVENRFWGDRMGTLRDPFGHHWSLAMRIENTPPAVMNKRMEEMFAVSR